MSVLLLLRQHLTPCEAEVTLSGHKGIKSAASNFWLGQRIQRTNHIFIGGLPQQYLPNQVRIMVLFSLKVNVKGCFLLLVENWSWLGFARVSTIECCYTSCLPACSVVKAAVYTHGYTPGYLLPGTSRGCTCAERWKAQVFLSLLARALNSHGRDFECNVNLRSVLWRRSYLNWALPLRILQMHWVFVESWPVWNSYFFFSPLESETFPQLHRLHWDNWNE